MKVSCSIRPEQGVGIDVEGRRWRAWKMDDAFPEAVEPEKEFDFLATEDLLLGNCFWREGFEAAFGPDRMGEKGGYAFRRMELFVN